MANVSANWVLRHQNPTVKTLRDKLRAMMLARKKLSRRNNASSGIYEVETEEE